MTYKITNKLNQTIKLGNIIFQAGETKVLNDKPYSDKFIVEEIKEKSYSDKPKTEKIKQEKKLTKFKENKE